ncbi:beta-ketoacyl synthase N-terminal-like domain-containing protein [Phytohabitans flavus]
MRACAAGYLDVLSGRRPGTAVLLPDGSDALVADVYRHNRRADHLNGLVAEAVSALARALPADQEPLSVLEIGAGTGATTEAVLAALRQSGLVGSVRYEFTDISPALAHRGGDRFAGQGVPLSTRILDIEGDLAAQGFDGRRYDVVVASNVLHATGDLRHTLAQVARLLRPGGLLLLNEVTRAHPFLTLTFGLAEGWWKHKDGLRLPHAPLLDEPGWRAVLTDAGLRGGWAFGPADGGQHVIVAEQDGWRPEIAGVTSETASQHRTAEERHTDRAVSGPDDTDVDYLRGVYAGVLRLDPAEIDPRAPMSTYGADSLVAMEVAAVIEERYGPVPKESLLAGGSLLSIAETLGEARTGRVPAPPTGLHNGGQDRVDAQPEARPAEPIAVVGLAGRYPGAATVDDFWRLLRDGRRAVTEIPAQRWPVDPDDGTHRWGGFLEDIDQFDPLLFGISPREAELMDPQERLFLQVAWSTFEDAGYPPRRADDPRTGVGVFVGVMSGHYELLAAQSWGSGDRREGHSASWSIANRVSFCLGLGGPSMAVDTACSSSLTAVHLAAESLRRGDCDLALAGGVNLILHPGHHLGLARRKMLSSDGHARAFDRAADGMVTGEGVGAVLLKPLSAALRDGDRVYGCLLASGVNASGRTEGYTAPSAEAQTVLLSTVLARAGISPENVAYVEAQAVGAPVGDATEVESLITVHGGRGRDRCVVGSLKPNVGHLESASGIAQLTKVLLQMRAGQIAPTIDCANPVEGLTGPDAPLELADRLRPWPAVDGVPRCAAISSFGAGGANCHVVVQEPAASPRPPATETPRAVPLSARTPAQLRAVAERLAERLRSADPPDLADLAYTLQRGRTELAARLVVVAGDRDRLAEALTRFLAGQADPDLYAGGTPPPAEPPDGAIRVAAVTWAGGGTVDWSEVPGQTRATIVSLPAYPFDTGRYWLSMPTSPNGSTPGAAPVDRLEDGLDVVLTAMSDVLGVRPGDLTADDNVSDLGFDSVTLVELAQRLAELTGAAMNPAELYAYGSVGALARRVGTRADRTPAPVAERPPVAVASAADAVAWSQPDPAAADGTAIAIVGLAGTFPGGTDPDGLWESVVVGRDLIGEYPAERPPWSDPPADTRGGYIGMSTGSMRRSSRSRRVRRA